MIHHVELDTTETYIYRCYPMENTLRYAFGLPISYRGKGRWEVYLWHTIYRIWDGGRWGHPPTGSEIMIAIEDKMKNMGERRFRTLMGTFEVGRLKTYERMFSAFELTPITVQERTYNGITSKFQIVEFKRKCLAYLLACNHGAVGGVTCGRVDGQ